MRYLGILLILGTLVAMVVFMGSRGGSLDYVKQVKKSGDYGRGQAQQWAGVDDNGMRTADSVTFAAKKDTANKLQGLTVSTIAPGGPMEAHFGLAAGDVIVEVGPQTVRDIADAELAKDLALEAYQRQWTLVVKRGDARYSLPQDKATAATAAAAAPAPAVTPTGIPVAPTAGAAP